MSDRSRTGRAHGWLWASGTRPRADVTVRTVGVADLGGLVRGDALSAGGVRRVGLGGRAGRAGPHPSGVHGARVRRAAHRKKRSDAANKSCARSQGTAAAGRRKFAVLASGRRHGQSISAVYSLVVSHVRAPRPVPSPLSSASQARPPAATRNEDDFARRAFQRERERGLASTPTRRVHLVVRARPLPPAAAPPARCAARRCAAGRRVLVVVPRAKNRSAVILPRFCRDSPILPLVLSAAIPPYSAILLPSSPISLSFCHFSTRFCHCSCARCRRSVVVLPSSTLFCPLSTHVCRWILPHSAAGRSGARRRRVRRRGGGSAVSQTTRSTAATKKWRQIQRRRPRRRRRRRRCCTAASPARSAPAAPASAPPASRTTSRPSPSGPATSNGSSGSSSTGRPTCAPVRPSRHGTTPCNGDRSRGP